MKTITIEVDLRIKTEEGEIITKNAGSCIFTEDPFYTIALDYYKETLEDLATVLALVSSNIECHTKLCEIAVDDMECTCPLKKKAEQASSFGFSRTLSLKRKSFA